MPTNDPLPPLTYRWQKPAGYTAIACLLVGLMLTAMQGWKFLGLNLLYSHCIGFSCWLLIDGSRIWVARQLLRRHPAHRDYANCWPGWGWMSTCVVLGTLLGYSLGQQLGDLLSGQQTGRFWRMGFGQAAAMLTVVVITSAITTLFFYTRGRMETAHADAEHARRVAAETQLRLLQSQLEPHMLFNTLANLRMLIGMDAGRAQTMLDQLIAFLRATLEASRVGSHTLQAEFQRLQDYLSLMQVRMGTRLNVELQLPAGLSGAEVPALLLQPLVENAIQHGLEPKIEGGHLHVHALQEGDTLVLSVQDDGLGRQAEASTGTGFGLRQIRERLHAQYGDQAKFQLEFPADGGCHATVRLPLKLTNADTFSR